MLAPGGSLRAPKRFQPRCCSATQRPFRELWPADVSRGSPVGSCALPLPLPRFLAAIGGAGCSYLAAVPGRAGRGAAAALGCDPGGFTSGSHSAGAGRGGPGWGRQGRYLRAGGTPGVSRDPRLPALPTAPRLHSTVPRSVACPQRPPPRRGYKTPREAPGGVGGRRGEL